MTILAGASTAFSMGVQRAAHQRVDPAPHILDGDADWALLSHDEQALIIERPGLFENSVARGLRARVLVRQRYAERALAEFARDGAIQYVILGAGMDSFSLRQPPWAGGLRIFEVDRREEQTRKRQRLADAGLPAAANLHFIAVDLDNEPLLERLLEGGLDPRVPTFFSCLGVLVYLSPAGVEQVLRLPLAMGSPSEMVFTIATPGARSADRLIARYAAAAGEPWRNLMDPVETTARLQDIGYRAVVCAEGAELAQGLPENTARRVIDDSARLFRIST